MNKINIYANCLNYILADRLRCKQPHFYVINNVMKESCNILFVTCAKTAE